MIRVEQDQCRYGLVTEQRKGAYKYFVDLGDRMEVAGSRTIYVDEVRELVERCRNVRVVGLMTPRPQDREAEVEKSKVVFGMSLGETVGAEEDEDETSLGGVTRSVAARSRVGSTRRFSMDVPADWLTLQVFYTPDEVKSFRTIGLEPRAHGTFLNFFPSMTRCIRD